MNTIFKTIHRKYSAVIEQQGFPIVITVCVCVITATALWTKAPASHTHAVPPAVAQDISASQLLQQSLKDPVAASPIPQNQHSGYSSPLTAYTLLTPFNENSMRCSSVTGIWAIHDAADLQAQLGQPVFAIADGIILDLGENELQGAWISIDHHNGLKALYAGMSKGESLAVGEQVQCGDIIGYIGKGTLAESDLPPHLHLRVTSNEAAIDPLLLWE